MLRRNGRIRPPVFSAKDEEIHSDEDELHTIAIFSLNSPEESLLGNHAEATSPGATVLQSMKPPVYDDSDGEEDYLEFIQYLANQSQQQSKPTWDDSPSGTETDPDWVNPFATEQTPPGSNKK